MKNLTLVDGIIPYLPGVFDHNPAQGGYNWPIWTLEVELKCYSAVALLGMLGIIRRPAILAVTACLVIVLLYLTLGRLGFVDGNFWYNVFAVRGGYSFLPAGMFAVGVLSYALKDIISVNLPLVVGITILTYLIRNTVFFSILFYFSMIAVILWFSLSGIFRKFVPRYDISYGTYIYGFTVQQVFVYLRPEWSWWVNLIASLAVTIPLSLMSWLYIERPCLEFARKIARRDWHRAVMP